VREQEAQRRELAHPAAVVVEDDETTRRALEEWLDSKGFSTRGAENLAAARDLIVQTMPDLILTDLQLPDGEGLELLPDAAEGEHKPEVVVITGHSSVETVVEALRRGALDYLSKPVDLQRLQAALEKVRRATDVKRLGVSIDEQLERQSGFGGFIGTSPAMRRVYEHILRVAPTETSVFIIGETGSGKEVAARTIHDLSPRRDGPFVAINCGAVPSELIESEMFGHEKGSFTGAVSRREGVFAQARGGTLFLDELAAMPGELQVKLLRVLEAREFQRVGGDELIKADVRLIVATLEEPERAVIEGRLREDLLYRLLVFPLFLPPLRQRAGDVRLLADHVLEEMNRREAEPKQLSEAALAKLERHSWPGNVRELRNVLMRAFILSDRTIGPNAINTIARRSATPVEEGIAVEIGTSIADAERALILATLEHCGGDKRRTAEVLGVSLKTLYNRLNEYANRDDAT
jgi:DNA-binding NtrC family response regulator